MQQHSRPLWLAVLISPWVAPIGFALYFVVYDLMHYQTLALRDWSAVASGALILMLPGSYVATCLFGLPYVLWLRSRRALSVPSVCAGAVVAGLAAAMVYADIFGGSVSSADPMIIRMGVAIGLLSGLCFCLVAGVRLRQLQRIDD